MTNPKKKKIIKDGAVVQIDMMQADSAIESAEGLLFDAEETVAVENVHRTKDGYISASARVARTGIQEYLGSNFGDAFEGKTMVRLYRPEDEVFDEDSIKSYAHRPVTVDHPKGGVTAETWRHLAVGHTGDTVIRDGNFVRLNFMVMDGNAIKTIDDGHKELSMGYATRVIVEEGVTPEGEAYDGIMTTLRMNHLAVVPKARGGSELRIGDDNGKEPTMADPIKTRTVLVDGLQVEATDSSAVAIEKLLGDKQSIAAKLSDAETQLADAKANLAKKDEEIGGLKAQVKQLEDAQADPALIDKMVADRADLVAKVTALDSSIKVAGKTDAQLRREAVAKVLGDATVKDASDEQIMGMFRVVSDKSDPVKRALNAGHNSPVKTNVADANEVYAETVTAMQDAWKRKEA